MRYKNIFALLLALALLCGSLSGCAAGQPARSAEPTASFTDSLRPRASTNISTRV